MGDNSIYQRASPAESDEINLTSGDADQTISKHIHFPLAPWHNIRPMIEHHGSPPVPLMARPLHSPVSNTEPTLNVIEKICAMC